MSMNHCILSRRAVIAVCTIAISVAGTCWATAAGTPQADVKQGLAARVAELEQRLADVERQLVSRPAYVTVVPAVPNPADPNGTSPHVLPFSQTLPPQGKNWQQREFNGSPFWIVPLSQKVTKGE